MADSELFLGLISGTSADGVDAALVRFDRGVEVLAAHTVDYPPPLRAQILALNRSEASISVQEFGQLDVHIAHSFADAAMALLQQASLPASKVIAIGSHGQTVRHRPESNPPFTMQLGDPSVIAECTGIDVVADFRRADVAAGGHGAPLAPAFHAGVFGAADTNRAILNLGGIANVTLLAPGTAVLGFDTGPANCLLDAWAQQQLGHARDDGGEWAASGSVDSALLARCLDDPYFAAAPPKSTGREYFHLEWLKSRMLNTKPADVQATLLALTVRTIADAINTHSGTIREVLACGGGVHNPVLMSALAEALHPIAVRSTSELGLDADFVEAAAFAWLARERLAGRPGNLPSVTGARGPRILGGVYRAPRQESGR